MAPFLILVSCWLVFGVAGRLAVPWFDSPAKAGRAALAVMFVFTGVTHFTPMKHDYLAMIPAPLPNHLGLIYLTGVLELAGGVGLLVPGVRRPAALGLIVLLVAMFPANVNAALGEIPFRGESATALWLRAPIQLAFIVSVWWCGVRSENPRPPVVS